MDCGIAAKMVEKLNVESEYICFGEYVGNCDLHDVTTDHPQNVGKMVFSLYIYINIYI